MVIKTFNCRLLVKLAPQLLYRLRNTVANVFQKISRVFGSYSTGLAFANDFHGRSIISIFSGMRVGTSCAGQRLLDTYESGVMPALVTSQILLQK